MATRINSNLFINLFPDTCNIFTKVAFVVTCQHCWLIKAWIADCPCTHTSQEGGENLWLTLPERKCPQKARHKSKNSFPISPPLSKMIVAFFLFFFLRGEVTQCCLNAMIRVSGKQKWMADEYFINVSSTYWTQGLIDGKSGCKGLDAEGPQPPFTPVLTSSTIVNRRIKMYLAEELFIKGLL